MPFGFAVCIGYIISIRLDLLAQFGVEALATAADEEQPQEQQESKHTKQFWKRLKRDLGSSDLNYGFPALETKSMNEWRSDIQRKYGPSGQLLVSFFLYYHFYRLTHGQVYGYAGSAGTRQEVKVLLEKLADC